MTKDERIAELEEQLLVAKSFIKREHPEICKVCAKKYLGEDIIDIIFTLDAFYEINEKQLRHEICEKIRNKAIPVYFNSAKVEPIAWEIYIKDLDQIERGEE